MDLAYSSGGHVGRPDRARWARVLIFGIGVGLVAGVGAAAATFEARGQVMAVSTSRTAVTLEHGGIPGLLPAARSEFPVASAALLEGVRPGDRIRFTLAAADESHGLLTVASLAPDVAGGGAWPDRLMTTVAAIVAFLALATSVVVGILLWRSLQALHRCVVALDHETGMLRSDVTDTRDGIGQIARALEDVATTFRVGYVRELRRRLATASAATAAEGRPSSGPDRTLVVVQRGRGELYQAVQSGAVGPGCTAMWDRRRGERRAGSRHHPQGDERRRGERRASPPETWTRLGFHLVPGGHAEAARGPRSARAASGERGAAR